MLILGPSALALGGGVAYSVAVKRVTRRRRDLAPNPPGWDAAVREYVSDADAPVEELEVRWVEGNRCPRCGRIVRLSRARRLRRAWVNHAADCSARGKRPDRVVAP